MSILAFDYGLARVGVAWANASLKIAHPIGVIKNQQLGKSTNRKANSINELNFVSKHKLCLDMIAAIVHKWQPYLLIVGMPYIVHYGHASSISKAITYFANSLEQTFSLPVHLVDEDFSSTDASAKLNAQEIYGMAQKHQLDQIAACNIMDTYFSSIIKLSLPS
jgi:putative holliday junction resolvase